MKKIIKIISIILAAVIIASTLSSCSGGEKNIDFIYPFNADIASFDPQVASTADEFLIIENCFEGLVRVDDSGEIQKGAAESWSVSDDGLVYTFKIKQGLKWRVLSNIEDKLTKAQELMGKDFNPDITAHDFVFALQRAVLPATECPLFASISSIENAVKIHNGKLSASKLGVKAIDDYTLEIRLTEADNSFISTLSTSVAMPCNEAYFNATKGRYGLGLDYTIFNGQFYIKSILEASYILDNNDQYKGDHPSNVSDITLKFIDSDTNIAKNLKSGYFDCAYLSGNDYDALDDDEITATPYSNKTWAMVLNKNRQLLSSKTMRKAVCLSISSIDLSEHKYLSKATNLIPPSCSIYGVSIDDAIGKTVDGYNPEKAVELWKKGLSEEGFTSASFTVIAPENMEDVVKKYVQGIQGSIGKVSAYRYNGDTNQISFSLEVKLLSNEDFASAFNKGEYDLALYQFEATSSNAEVFLKKIIDGNYAGEIKSVSDALKKAQASNAKNAAKNIGACEKELLGDYSIFPVMYESSYYAMAKGVSGVNFHAGSGRVSFVYANREN